MVYEMYILCYDFKFLFFGRQDKRKTCRKKRRVPHEKLCMLILKKVRLRMLMVGKSMLAESLKICLQKLPVLFRQHFNLV